MCLNSLFCRCRAQVADRRSSASAARVSADQKEFKGLMESPGGIWVRLLVLSSRKLPLFVRIDLNPFEHGDYFFADALQGAWKLFQGRGVLDSWLFFIMANQSFAEWLWADWER